MTATEVAGAAKDHLKARAAKLAPRDTYPLLNEARIDLLLSRVDPSRGAAAKDQFGSAADGVDAYRAAIESMPVELRPDVLRSVLAGLNSIESISELDADVTAALAQVRSLIVDRSGIGSGPMTG